MPNRLRDRAKNPKGSSIKKISAKWFATVSLISSVITAKPLVAANSASEVAAWNGNLVQANVSPGLSHVVAIAAGGSRNRARTSTGGIVAAAITHYVDGNAANPTPPYTSWATGNESSEKCSWRSSSTLRHRARSEPQAPSR